MNNTQKVTVELKNGKFHLANGAKIDNLNPKALLLCATAQCAGLTIMGILGKENIMPKRCEIAIEGALDTARLQAESKFRSFFICYNIECRSLTEQKTVSEAINTAQERLCGMIVMLRKIAPVSHEISIVSSETVNV